jgi:hypothetical protein
LEGHFEAGTIKPLEYELVDGLGWGRLIGGIRQLEDGKVSKKLVVKVQEE